MTQSAKQIISDATNEGIQAAAKSGRVLHATRSAIISESEIKELIKKTTCKTADFIAAVLTDACDENGKLETADGKVLRFKSIKSPKALIAFWEKHSLPVGALARHVKATWQKSEQKPVKTAKAKAEKKAKAAKPAKAKTTRKPRKTATILQISDHRQGDLNLDVVAA
jgi:hypothetical protein